MEVFENEKASTVEFLRLLYKKKGIVIGAIILSLGLSILVTSLMSPRFYSFAIIFPTNTNSSAAILDNPQFGYDLDADRLMQLLESELMRDSIVELYDLIAYYEVDTTRLDWKHQLDIRFIRDVSFYRTKYMSVVIAVTTKQPKLSASIANSIIDILDGLRERIFEENSYQALVTIEEEYFNKQTYVDQLVDSIYQLRSANTSESASLLYQRIKHKQSIVSEYQRQLSGMRKENSFYNLGAEIEMLNQKYSNSNAFVIEQEGKYNTLKETFKTTDTLMVNLKARIDGARLNAEYCEKELNRLGVLQQSYSNINQQLENATLQLSSLQVEHETLLNSYESEVSSIRLNRLIDIYEYEQARLNEMKRNYEEAKKKYDSPFPGVYIIDRAKPSYKKISPSYTFNVLIGVSSTFVFTIIFLVLWDKFKHVRAQIVKA